MVEHKEPVLVNVVLSKTKKKKSNDTKMLNLAYYNLENVIMTIF